MQRMRRHIVRDLVGLLFTVLISCCIFEGLVEGSSKSGAVKLRCTTQTNRCCKLGRKAARHHLISPFYTCYYEALIAGLDHQTSVAKRMRLAYRGRLKYTKTIVKTTAFRSRLASCYGLRNKRCFESCCSAKRRAMLKRSRHVIATPSSSNITGIPKI